MAATKTRTSSFSRSFSGASSPQIPGLKHGPNGTMFVSSGIPDLDKILGGGFAQGSLVMVMEDAEAPHHMLLLRNFMSQGLVHNQPLLYASPAKDPRQFLGTLPSPAVPKDEKSSHRDPDQEKGLRIAWQYKKYFGENQQGFDSQMWIFQPGMGHTSFRRSLKSMLRSSNAVVVVTFPPSLLSSSSSTRWQHMADTLLSVQAIPDEDKELATLLTGTRTWLAFLMCRK